MKLIIVYLFCLFIPFTGQPHHLQGTFKYKLGKGSGAPTGLLQIHCSNSSSILFYLQLVGPAPALNSGGIYGKLIYNKKNNNYEYLPSEQGDCKLVFTVSKNKVSIKTASGDCQFGHGVYADGDFYLTDSSNPQYVITLTDKKVYFDKTQPENFRED
jgi:hypothetical protein